MKDHSVNDVTVFLLIWSSQACKKKLYEEKYVWFIIGWYPDNRYKVKDNLHNRNCEAARGGPWRWLYHSLSSTVETKHDRSWYGK